jgi:hypothetical protein
MQPNRIPNDARRDVVILVAKHIANRGDVTPGNVGVLSLSSPGMCRDASEMTSMHRSTARWVFLISEVLFESQVGCVCSCLRDVVDHFFDNDIQRAGHQSTLTASFRMRGSRS